MHSALSRPILWSPQRLALVAFGWVVLGVLQAGLLVASAKDTPRTAALFALYLGIAVGWAILTPLAGTLSQGLRRRSAITAIAGHVAILLACGVADTAVRRALTVALGAQLGLPWYGTLLYFADRTFLGYLIIVVLTRTLASHDHFVARQRQALALQAQLTRARLASLEDQLHPHFLFNALGAVTELAHEAPARAAQMLKQLASVLRFAMERRGGEVTVREELAALEPYLEVQRTRFADWITIDVQVSDSASVLLVPPLILQPLIENSIRHGLSGRDRPGTLTVKAEERGGELVIQVRDNGVGLHQPRPKESRGIGLSNVRERLSALYGHRAELMLYDDERGGAVAQLSLPARLIPERMDQAPIIAIDEDAAETPLPRIFREHPALLIPLAWAIWGFLWTQQSIAYLAFRGRLGNQTFAQIAWRDFKTAMIWAVLTPLMLLMLRVVPLRAHLMPVRLAAHAAAAVAIGALQGLIAQRVLDTSFPILSSEGIASITWGILAYAVVLGVGHQNQIRTWLRDRELADSRMRVGIAEAELQAKTSRTRPQELLDRLEAIGGTIQQDAAGAERALARLGDQLRESLDARVPA